MWYMIYCYHLKTVHLELFISIFPEFPIQPQSFFYNKTFDTRKRILLHVTLHAFYFFPTHSLLCFSFFFFKQHPSLCEHFSLVTQTYTMNLITNAKRESGETFSRKTKFVRYSCYHVFLGAILFHTNSVAILLMILPKNLGFQILLRTIKMQKKKKKKMCSAIQFKQAKQFLVFVIKVLNFLPPQLSC